MGVLLVGGSWPGLAPSRYNVCMTKIRELRASLARETVAILERGTYTSPNGVVVDLGEEIARAVSGTVEYAPDADLPNPSPNPARMRIEVTPEGTFEAAHRLRDANPVVLNFASAKHPGRWVPRWRPGPGGGAGPGQRAVRLHQGPRHVPHEPAARHSLQRCHDPFAGGSRDP